MNSTEAIQILSRKMSKASTQEREAFNYLIDYISVKHREVILDNQHFGKLYIYLYGQFIKHYETTLFDPIPQKELHKILDTPIRNLVTNFVNDINTGEMYQDASGKTATWEYEQVAENLRVMVNKALEELN